MGKAAQVEKGRGCHRSTRKSQIECRLAFGERSRPRGRLAGRTNEGNLACLLFFRDFRTETRKKLRQCKKSSCACPGLCLDSPPPALLRRMFGAPDGADLVNGPADERRKNLRQVTGGRAAKLGRNRLSFCLALFDIDGTLKRYAGGLVCHSTDWMSVYRALRVSAR